MFYLIGVAHRVQQFDNWDALNEDQNRLVQTIRSAIERFSPRVIAEEHSSEALGASHSIAGRLAEESRLEHRFCDPESGWRQSVGYKGRDDLELQIAMNSWDQPTLDVRCGRAGAIEMAVYSPMREQYWFDCLSDLLRENVVFVCGQAHILSFSQLLRSKGAEVTVVAERIGVNAEDDRVVALARDYLAAHPDPTRDEPGVGNLRQPPFELPEITRA